MKILARIVHHHFSKIELLAEEIILVVVLLTIFAMSALATEALLPIKVNIVRCVTPEERVQMCEERDLCCNLVSSESKISQNQTATTSAKENSD